MARTAKAVLQKYGVGWTTTDQMAIELECIRRNGEWNDHLGKKCGAGLAHHVKAFQTLVWPDKQWQKWNEGLILPELCKGGTVAIFGPASSGKTHEAADFVLTMYFAFPDSFTGLCSSTTRELLNLRIWGQIKRRFREAKERCDWLPGHLIDSALQITTDGKEVEGREFRNGIKGLPCKRGSEWQGLSDYSGLKNKFVLLAADEVHTMEPGFLQGASNLKSNPRFQAIYLGNLNDLSSPLGEAAEPELGWDAIPDSDKSRSYKTRYLNGRAIQLIGMDSPNLDYPEGKEPFHFLIGRRYLKEAEHDYGKDTPLYNMMAAGKIPRGTMENRVITKKVCLKFHAFEEVEWGHEKITKLYCADISYNADHGDRTVGMPMGFGVDVEGKLRLAPLERPLVYAPSDRATGTIEEQIALQMRAECQRMGIPPEHVFFDGSGRSSFTAAVMRLWTTAVNALDFGGRATDRPNFIGKRYQDDQGGKKRKGELLPCSEVFGKFVTELWFAWRYLVENDQCRGMYEEIAKEGYMRLWKLTAGNKIDVEPKPELKLRLGRSPDLADTFCVGVEGARRLGFSLGKLYQLKTKEAVWIKKAVREFEESNRAQELTYN